MKTAPVLFLAPAPIPAALAAMEAALKPLRDSFTKHKFTPDGRLIGDLGEVIAEIDFDLTKLKTGSKLHDFESREGIKVQVKITQKKAGGAGVGLGLTKETFEHLLVFEIDSFGQYEVLFNGPGSYIDEARAHKSSPSMSRNQLRKCQLLVPESKRLPRRVTPIAGTAA